MFGFSSDPFDETKDESLLEDSGGSDPGNAGFDMAKQRRDFLGGGTPEQLEQAAPLDADQRERQREFITTRREARDHLKFQRNRPDHRLEPDEQEILDKALTGYEHMTGISKDELRRWEDFRARTNRTADLRAMGRGRVGDSTVRADLQYQDFRRREREASSGFIRTGTPPPLATPIEQGSIPPTAAKAGIK